MIARTDASFLEISRVFFVELFLDLRIGEAWRQSDEGLQNPHKALTLELVRDFVSLLREHGIVHQGCMITYTRPAADCFLVTSDN
jgi:hypothetical protein